MADKDDIKRLQQEIKRANSAKALAEARANYIRLMENDDWRVSQRALTDAMPILRTIGIAYPTE